MSRKVLWPIFAIGVALIIAPLVISMPSRANAGARMMSDFNPIMQPDNVKKTADYYYNVFVPLGNVVPMMTKANVQKFQGYTQGFSGMQADAQKLVPALAQALHMTPAQVQQYMGKEFPTMSAMLQNLPQMQRDFNGFLGTMEKNVPIFRQVPAGLVHYKPLVTTMQANVSNYDKANSLPSFKLLPWFFIVPGILLVLLSGWGLLSGRHETVATGMRPHPAA